MARYEQREIPTIDSFFNNALGWLGKTRLGQVGVAAYSAFTLAACGSSSTGPDPKPGPDNNPPVAQNTDLHWQNDTLYADAAFTDPDGDELQLTFAQPYDTTTANPASIKTHVPQTRQEQDMNVRVTADDGKTGGTTSATLNTTVPALEDEAPEATLTGDTNIETTRQARFTLTAQDDFALQDADITWGDGQTTTIDLAERTSIDTTLTHTYTDAGTYAPSATVTDDASHETTATHEIDVSQRTTHLALDAKLYWSQETNTGIKVRVQNETTGQDTTLTLGNGRWEGDVDYGPLTLTIDDTDGNSEMHRMRVGTISGENSFLNGQNRYLITDYNDRPIQLEPREELATTIETWDNEHRLEEMATQWGKDAKTAIVGEPHEFLMYHGNPDCRFKNPRLYRGIVCDDDTPWVLGIPADQRFEDLFDGWLERMETMVDRQRIGWDPFDFRIVKADTSNIEQYVHRNEHGGWSPNDGVTWVVRSGYPGAEGRKEAVRENGARYVKRAFIAIPGHEEGLFSAEDQTKGGYMESSPPICSIRDHDEEELLDGCPVIGDTYYYPKDIQFHEIAGAYLAPGQLQGFETVRIAP